MLTSKVQLGYVLTEGGGKLSRAVYLAPRPEFQRELIIPKFYYTICYRNIKLKLIKTLFQSIWDAHFKRSVGLYIDKGWGGKLSRAVYLAPRPEFQREWIISNFYNIIYFRNI